MKIVTQSTNSPIELTFNVNINTECGRLSELQKYLPFDPDQNYDITKGLEIVTRRYKKFEKKKYHKRVYTGSGFFKRLIRIWIVNFLNIGFEFFFELRLLE